MRGAAGANIGGGGVEVEVCEPGVDGSAPAEGDDDEVVGAVDGNKAGYIG
jgi:hypothetical protein